MNMPTKPDAGFAAVDYDPFATPSAERVVPTTEVQREVWLADRLGREASLAYNESISLTFGGPLNVQAMTDAVKALTDRHDALRATIGVDGQELLIAATLDIDVPVIDLSHKAKDEQQRIVAEAKQAAVVSPFNLETGPLIRAGILKLSDSEYILIVTAHHAVCDGW